MAKQVRYQIMVGLNKLSDVLVLPASSLAVSAMSFAVSHEPLSFLSNNKSVGKMEEKK
ncbi:hypothetical protein HY638_05665 [Candidatus Woesearchaeota archaeon]|nr:hypothetical protein [Candidatus Woesearchaeota archaeon]